MYCNAHKANVNFVRISKHTLIKSKMYINSNGE